MTSDTEQVREIVSRKQAISDGLDYYFTGKLCKHGHLSQRRTIGRICIECERDWGRKNREKVNAKNKKYRADNLERERERGREYHAKNRAEENAKSRKYHRENRDAILERQRIYREKNREHVLSLDREWSRRNPVKVAAKARNRRAIIRNSDGHHTAKDVARIIARQKHKCVNCDACLRGGYEVDHIMPLALGGGNGPKNLQCLCPPCNAKKHAKHPIDWAQENGRLL